MASKLKLQHGERNEKVFEPDWFKEHGLQGFVIKHIEAKSEHLQNLKMSIKNNGYNGKEPIIVAKSKDPMASGCVLDGRLHSYSPLYHIPHNPYRVGSLRHLFKHRDSAEQRHLKGEAEKKLTDAESRKIEEQLKKKVVEQAEEDLEI